MASKRTGSDDVALGDRDLRADGNRISRERLVLRVADFDLRIEIFLVLDDDGRDAARRFVEFALHGDAGDHVLECERAALFGENRNVVRIPLREDGALLDLLAVADVEEGTDHDVVGFEFLILGVEDLDRAGLVEDDAGAVGGLRRGGGPCTSRCRWRGREFQES